MSLQSFAPQAAARKAVLLSIKPKYSELILSGAKRVEFRRRWAASEVGLIAIYATAPVRRIVAFVAVEDVVWASPNELRRHCAERGGALSQQELSDYFGGGRHGYAVLLGRVQKINAPIDPRNVFTGFSAPQSFRYLTEAEIDTLTRFS